MENGGLPFSRKNSIEVLDIAGNDSNLLASWLDSEASVLV